jgi:hypothetical protein
MLARRITELERDLENERFTIRRQRLLKQIWKLRSRLELESATSDGPYEQPTRSLKTLRSQRTKDSHVAMEQSPASTAV